MSFLATTLGTSGFDQQVLHWINCGLSGPWADAVLLTLQRAIVGIVVMLVGIGIVFDKDRRLGLRTLLTALMAYGLCMGIADLAWHAHHRVRPGRAAEVVLRTPSEIGACAAQPEAVVVRKHVSRRSGMPSRHALSSGVFAVTMLLASRWLGVVACLYAFLVAVARVYSGVHWPTDVLVGLVLGGLVAWLVWRILPPLFGRLGRRHLVAAPVLSPESAGASGSQGASG